MAIVKANYLPRGRTARAAAKYYTFRDGPDRLTRIWHTSDGRAAMYDEVQAELVAGAAAYAYPYRIVLSTQAVDPGPAGSHPRLALGLAAVWLLCGAVNYLILGRPIPDHQMRALWAVAYGPAFGPLHIAQ